MLVARYSYGYYPAILPALLNLMYVPARLFSVSSRLLTRIGTDHSLVSARSTRLSVVKSYKRSTQESYQQQ